MQASIANRWGGHRVALIALLAAIVIAMQWWVGDLTIYAPDLVTTRAAIHRAILDNEAPGGRLWSDLGGAGLNIRVGVVYLAEGVRRATDFPIGQIYKLLDTVFLFAALLAFAAYLRQWLPAPYVLIGLLYLATMLPLTYMLHAFQPWDRLQLLLWILLLYLTLHRRLVWLGVTLAASMAVKFDVILFPLLYAMAHAERGQYRRVASESAMLAAITVASYVALKVWLPAPLEPARFSLDGAYHQVGVNLAALAALKFRHPTLLVLGLPMIVALLDLRLHARFVRACVTFALGMSAVWFAFTNYAEVRAQVGVLVLLLPAALLSLQRRLAAA